ncbi:glycosyltransferase [Novosphingobium aquimarinum]|uniref:glycosyltransferase n=1 Tax=Novosphingobium aquimarinum TaxID=2682494 RepID=UPI0012EC0318|nr:glycosyltransferase [Novosphingobium aquimarinum]
MPTPLKVAFVLPHLRPGGAEMAVLNWLSALPRDEFAPVLLLKRLEGALLSRVPADVPVIAVGGRRAAGFAWRLQKALNAQQVDLAYSATSAANLALAVTGLLPGRKARLFISEHTTPAAFTQEAKWPWLRRLLTRHLYPRATAALVPTDAIAADLAAMVPHIPVHVVPNPVVAFRPEEPDRPHTAQTGGRPFTILAAGRLVSAKGFDVLLDAAARLRDLGHDIRLTICGEGPLRAELEAQAESLRIRPFTTFAGYCADLPSRMRRSDAFVLSSRREGFGNVIVEAMHEGCPVIAANLPGPAALIWDKRTGLLVEPEDPQYFAEAIASLVNDPQLARRLAVAGRDGTRKYDIGASARILAERFRSED